MVLHEECFTEEEKKKIYETLASVGPLEPSNSSTFKLNCSGFEISIGASSHQEAATKFGHCLFALNELDANMKENPLTFQCESLESAKRVEYLCYVTGCGTEKKPIIVTNRILKRVSCDLSGQRDKQLESGISGINVTRLDRGDDSDYISEAIGEKVDEIIDGTLHRYFGYSNFKPLQRDIIKTTLSGKDVLGILSTGSGKSLTFLLPAVLSSSPTFVVVPTKALIDDLLMHCQDLNIAACKFTGSTPQEHQMSQLENFESYKIILATPELVENDLLDKLKSTTLERIVFDEAHTITTWGNTFCPVYKSTCELLSKLPVPKLLLSATVPVHCQQELLQTFGTFVSIRNTVFRDNLCLNVEERSNGPKFYDQLASFIIKGHEGCGIVYCVFTSDVTKIHAEMIKRDISCAMYHGQLSEDVKLANFNKWNIGESNVMIANAAFGLGIDKANVRLVAHTPILKQYWKYLHNYFHLIKF